jgi:hypothetical protein
MSQEAHQPLAATLSTGEKVAASLVVAAKLNWLTVYVAVELNP